VKCRNMLRRTRERTGTSTSPARSPSRRIWSAAEEQQLEQIWRQCPIAKATSDSEYWTMAAGLLGTNRTPEAVRQHWSNMTARRRPMPRAPLWTRLQRTSVPLQWRALALRHTFYAMSSTFYALAGLAFCYAEHGRPHALFGEPIIWVLQTVFTHQSDVATLGEDSIWHAVDRLHAYAFTILRASYTFYAYFVWGAYSQIQAAVFAVGLSLALCCIRLSWMAVMRRDAVAFLRWHALWHLMLPSTALCVAALFDV
jgi:hypothetical protein